MTTKKSQTTKGKGKGKQAPSFSDVSQEKGGATETIAKAESTASGMMDVIINSGNNELKKEAEMLTIAINSTPDDSSKEWANKFIVSDTNPMIDVSEGVFKPDEDFIRSIFVKVHEMFFTLMSKYYDEGVIAIDKQRITEVLTDVALAALEEHPDTTMVMSSYDVKSLARTYILEEYLKEDEVLNEIIDGVIKLNLAAEGKMNISFDENGLKFTPVGEVEKTEPEVIYIPTQGKVLVVETEEVPIVDVVVDPVTNKVDLETVAVVQQTGIKEYIVPKLNVDAANISVQTKRITNAILQRMVG